MVFGVFFGIMFFVLNKKLKFKWEPDEPTVPKQPQIQRGSVSPVTYTLAATNTASATTGYFTYCTTGTTSW